MAEQEATRRARRLPAAILAVVLLAWSIQAAPVSAQPRSQAADSELVGQLVLNSAVLRQAVEQKAARDQFALFQRLSETSVRLNSALAKVDLERTQRKRLQAELRTADSERRALVEQIARQNSEFANERRALVEQMTGIVAEASPEKRAALQRFAQGEREAGYAEVKQLTLAENQLRSLAASLASAENLKALLALHYERMLRGEATLDEREKLLRQIVALNPADTSTGILLARYLGSLQRHVEVVELAARIEPHLKDDWERLRFEAGILGSRAAARPLEEAVGPMQTVMRRILAARPPTSWSREEMATFCSAVDDFASTPAVISRPGVEDDARICIQQLAKAEQFDMNLFTLTHALAMYEINRRRPAEANRYLDLYNKLVAAFPGASQYAALKKFLEFKGRLVEMGLAELEGRRKAAGELAQSVLGLMPVMVSILGSEEKVSDELVHLRAKVRLIEADYRGARDLLKPLLDAAPDRTPPDVMSEADAWWITRQDQLNDYAAASLAVGEAAGASWALAEANRISVALQRVHPLDEPELVRATHPPVYNALMASALLRAKTRGLEGKPSEAEMKLEAVLRHIEPHIGLPIYQGSFPFFKVAALIELAGLGAQQKKLDLARSRYSAAQAAAEELARREPGAFLWAAALLEIRFRLAQLASDAGALAAVRAERDRLAAEGKALDPVEAWVRDLEDWRIGRPIRWQSGR
ncbi:MAG TPA: hypothetical protein VF759_04775 [Allosphingosinicella sp.]